MTQKQMVLDSEVEVKKVTRQVDIPFSISEFAELGKEAGSLSAKRDGHKKAAKDSQEALEAILEKIEHGKRQENVTCEMKLFYANRLVQVFHGEDLLEERAMTDAEFQQEFRGLEGDDQPEEEAEQRELTEEEAKQDLQDVINEEKSPTKPVAH